MRTTCSITAFTLALLLYYYCLAEGCRIEKKGRHKKKRRKKKKKRRKKRGGKGTQRRIWPMEPLATARLWSSKMSLVSPVNAAYVFECMWYMCLRP
jgi:hypothetical protein